MKRKEGYYWLKWETPEDLPDNWMVAYWNQSYWMVTGNDEAFEDEQFTFISPEPIPEPE